jgi:bla regulator protein blaR1
LWQGMLLAIAAGSVIFCTKRSTAAVRYGWICGLFFLFLATFGLTFFYELYRVEDNGVVAGSGFYSPAANVFLVQVDGLGQYCSAHALLIVSIWFLFFSVKSVRLAAGWGYMQHLRRERAVVAPAKWVERVKQLGGQLGIRQTVKLVESGLVRVPIVIGQLRPIIFIPLGLINQLPAGEMEAVLLHELAHIRRYDYVVNFLQQIAECLFFFNPGLLWISSLLREERENCCDDIAIARTRDRVEFVRALVRFKEHSLRGGAVLAFPAGKRQLLHRVLRISQQQNKMLNGGERLFLLVSCLVLVLLFFSLHRPGAWQEQGRGKEGNGHPAAETEMAMVERPVAVEVGSKELPAVLQTREQVAKNIRWVEQQLSRLHHTAKEKTGRRRAKRDAGKVEVEAEKVEVDGRQALQEEDGGTDKMQAERDKEQAMRDREQAQQDRDQAIKDRHQADLDRMQADKDRMLADLDRMRAEQERQQAVRERQQAERDRMQPSKEQPVEKKKA